MDQPALAGDRSSEGAPVENHPLAILPASLAGRTDHNAFVAVVRDADAFSRWMFDGHGALQWIEVHDLLGDEAVWRSAASGPSEIPLDVVMADPAKEFAWLYRLVDVRNVRPVRVSIPVASGLLKSLRLAASLQLPVRLLPGQPGEEVQDELVDAVEFYLHDPMVEAPFEFFHSALASLQLEEPGSLWTALEQDPAIFSRRDETAEPLLPGPSGGTDPKEWVARHVDVVSRTTECGGCSWLPFCRGFFKQPDPEYSCAGVLRVFDRLGSASAQIQNDLSEMPAGDPPPEAGQGGTVS